MSGPSDAPPAPIPPLPAPPRHLSPGFTKIGSNLAPEALCTLLHGEGGGGGEEGGRRIPGHLARSGVSPRALLTLESHSRLSFIHTDGRPFFFLPPLPPPDFFTAIDRVAKAQGVHKIGARPPSPRRGTPTRLRSRAVRAPKDGRCCPTSSPQCPLRSPLHLSSPFPSSSTPPLLPLPSAPSPSLPLPSETVGDAYVGSTGCVPGEEESSAQSNAESAARAARMALDMHAVAASVPSPEGSQLKLRVGLTAGPATAGIVGTTRLRYQ